MCGILGISFQNGSTIDSPETAKYLLRGLLAESRIRGVDATGVAFVSEKGIAVLKNDVGAKKFIADDAFKTACDAHVNLKTISIIGHCRMKTKGTEKDRHNNHPVIADNVVGVHNGVIGNDDELFKKFEDRFIRKGRVDTEIIFRLINYYVHTRKRKMSNAIRSTAAILSGCYACALVDKTKPYLLWLFRNYSPITIHNYTKCGVIIFASDGAFIQKAVGDTARLELGKPTKIVMPEHHCIGINLKTNSMYRFGLKSGNQMSNLESHYGYNYMM